MRVRFGLPGLCCLAGRGGRARGDPPGGFLEARGPTLNTQLPADGRDARERRRPLVFPACLQFFAKTFFNAWLQFFERPEKNRKQYETGLE